MVILGFAVSGTGGMGRSPENLKMGAPGSGDQCPFTHFGGAKTIRLTDWMMKIARTAVDRLTPALLAKAFRGELVPQDPNDEPASALLERLQASRTSQVKARRRAVTSKDTP